MKNAKKKLKRNAITLVIILIILSTSAMIETCSNKQILAKPNILTRKLV